MATAVKLKNTYLTKIANELTKQIGEAEHDIEIQFRQFDQAWPSDRFDYLPVSHFLIQTRHPNVRGWLFHVGSVSLLGDIDSSRIAKDVSIALEVLLKAYQEALDTSDSAE